MRESLNLVEFDITNSTELGELITFDESYGSTLSLQEPTGSLTIREGPNVHACDLTLRREGNSFKISTRTPTLPATIHPYSQALERELELTEWERLVRAFPPGSVEYTLEIPYEKPNRPAEGIFVFFSAQGAEELRRELRSSMLRDGDFRGVTILTPMTDAIVTSDGIVVAPLAASVLRQQSAALLIPDSAPEALRPFLLGLQTDYLGICVLRREFDEAAQFTLDAIRGLASWAQSHQFRRTLARRFLDEKILPTTNDELATLTRTLVLLEDELVGGALSTFESASATFREISVELLRDLHKMRGEILSLVGSELFQMCVTIAAVVAGLTIGELAAVPVVFGVALLVGAVFFLGALLKARTQEREFRDLIEFNREFDKLPIARAMPEFHGWYRRTLERSINAFYASLSAGIPIAGVPLYGVLALSINARWPAIPLWAPFILFALLAAAAGLRYWYAGPRAHLLPSQKPVA